MTKEDKELLIKILCAMLPYNVMLHIRYYDLQGSGDLDERDVELTYGNIGYCVSRSHWVDFKPYLRPMSSITDEERKEYEYFIIHRDHINAQGQEWDIDCFSFNNSSRLIDWLNAHHFDYRGLIEKRLAIAVTKENNPYKN